jgi:hypothetical protein
MRDDESDRIECDLHDLFQVMHDLRRVQTQQGAEGAPPSDDLDHAVWTLGGVIDRLLLDTRRMTPIRQVLEAATLESIIRQTLQWTFPHTDRVVIPFPALRLAGDGARIARALGWGLQALLVGDPLRLTVSLIPPCTVDAGIALVVTARMPDRAGVRPAPALPVWRQAVTLAAALGGTLSATMVAASAHLALMLPDEASAATPGEGLLAGWPVWWVGSPPDVRIARALRALGSLPPRPGVPDPWPDTGVLVIGPGGVPPHVPPGILCLRWSAARPEAARRPTAPGDLSLGPHDSLAHLVQRIGMAVRLHGMRLDHDAGASCYGGEEDAGASCYGGEEDAGASCYGGEEDAGASCYGGEEEEEPAAR